MKYINQLRSCILLVACLLAAPSLVFGNYYCQPERTVLQGTLITFESKYSVFAPNLTATLQQDFELPAVNSIALGLNTGSSHQPITKPLLIQGAILAKEHVTAAHSQLRFDPPANGYVVVKANKTFYSLSLKDGVARNSAEAELEVEPASAIPTRFSLQPGTSLEVTPKGLVRIKKGAILTWTLDSQNPLPVNLVKSTRLYETSDPAYPETLVAVKPRRAPNGGIMSFDVRRAGLNFQQEQLTFCFSANGLSFRSSPRVTLLKQSNDTATYDVAIPVDIEDTWFWDWYAFGRPITAVVTAIKDGVVIIHSAANITISSSRIAVLTSSIFVGIALLLSALFTRKLNVVSLMVRDQKGKLSLAKLQIVMWTVLVLFAMWFIWFTTAELIEVPGGILVLLGISAGTNVLARAVTGQNPNVVANQRSTESANAREKEQTQKSTDLADLVTSNGEFDPLRFQMLGFTLFAWFYVLVSILKHQGFPDIPESLYWLMGISNTAYIGGKFTTTREQPVAQNPISAASEFSGTQIKEIQRILRVSETGIVDSETQIAIKKYQLDHGIAPADGRLNKLLVAKILPYGKG